MIKLKVKKTGAWPEAKEILEKSEELKAAMHAAVLQEAQLVRTSIIKGITAQAPGGRRFAALSAITIALRKARGFGGKKALIATASMRNSVTVKTMGPGRVFVGVLRSARSKDGRELYNVARIQENGATFVIAVTPKMRIWLMIQLRKAGFATRVKDGKRTRFKSSGTGQMSTGVIVVKIPARPFIAPVIEQFASNPSAIRKRFHERIAKKMDLLLGE